MTAARREQAPTSSANPHPHSARAPDLVSWSYGITDPGKVRPLNEDQFLVATLARALWIRGSSVDQQPFRYADAEGLLFVVADGMGGALGGAEASAVAVDVIEDFLLTSLRWLFALNGTAERSGRDTLEEFKRALVRADARVCETAARHPELRGMGTTLTMAYAHGSELFIAHVGDSRCYLQRGAVLHQLTRDHTFVQDLVDRGLLQPEGVAEHDLRHVITNAVGGPRLGVSVEVHRVDLAPGDVLLLCTDGLTAMLPDADIAAVLHAEHDPRAACEALILAANERGGQDNVTAVVARFDRASAPSAGVGGMPHVEHN
jgi:protein phosphatase